MLLYNLWQNNKLKLKLKDFDFENIVLTGTINLANKDFWGLLTVLNSEWSHTPVVSLCVFSLVQTFCLTVRAYLNTQKYGLFCSLRPCVTHNLFNKSTIIFRGLYSFRTERDVKMFSSQVEPRAAG